MTGGHKLALSVAALGAIFLATAAADLVAPYPATAQHRDLPYAPPTRLRMVDDEGRFHLRPFVYRWAAAGAEGAPTEDRSRPYAVRFWVRDGDATLGRRLLGVEEPATLLLLGSDGLGRDIFSRLLYGGRTSLTVGLLAAFLATAIGLVVGGIAGHAGGWLDSLLMRGAELVQALPWLYLLLAVRAFLPLQLAAGWTVLILVTLIGLLGWVTPARLARSVVRTVKERDFVVAARALGATEPRVLGRHVLPHTAAPLLTHGALLVPRYILAEVTLSFLGLGVGDPFPSWGGMLRDLARLPVLLAHGWMVAPAVALLLVVFCFQTLAGCLEERLEPSSRAVMRDPHRPRAKST